MRNITLSVPDDLLKRAKWLAVQQETSLSKLLTGYLERVVAQHDEYERAQGERWTNCGKVFLWGHRQLL